MTAERAALLRDLHHAPDLLQVVNVWDVASARVVADVPGTRAIATASHAIAALYGYEDGERIPVELVLDLCGRIVEAVDLPVTADLEAGYGDVHGTIRRAIGVGVVGANLEDGLRGGGVKPLADAVHAVEAAVSAGEDEGVPFVLNARTDVLLAGVTPESVAEAVVRGRAFLDAGATCVFVPGRVDATVVGELVAGLGDRRVSVFGFPGAPLPRELEALGVARVSYGPLPQRVALAALQQAARDLYAGGGLGEVPTLT